MTVLLWILAAAMVLTGIAGTVLPALPGPFLVFAGLLLAGWADGFLHVGPFTFVILALLTAATVAMDFVSAAIGAKRAGASKRAALGAALGALAGLPLGLPGLIIGPFAGAVLAELTARRDLRQAGRAGLGAWIGFVVGIGAKLAIVIAMVAIFLTALIL